LHRLWHVVASCKQQLLVEQEWLHNRIAWKWVNGHKQVADRDGYDCNDESSRDGRCNLEKCLLIGQEEIRTWGDHRWDWSTPEKHVRGTHWVPQYKLTLVLESESECVPSWRAKSLASKGNLDVSVFGEVLHTVFQ
jgi:hypothetical protein